MKEQKCRKLLAEEAENAKLERARLKNAAPNCRGGKRETGKCETELQDWKTRERIGYGKPIKPKQPTHFHTLI